MRKLFFFLFLLLPVAVEAERPPIPADFAFGLPLTLAGEAALYEISLPPEVYRGMLEPDGADLRVFNADEEVVPHLLLREKDPEAAPLPIPLPLFPLRGTLAERGDELFLQVRKDAAGAIIEVRTNTPATEQFVLGYLLDAGRIDFPVAGLELDWRMASGFFAQVKVVASNDLERWTTLTTATVADLQHQGYRLQQCTIRFAPSRWKYFRIEFNDAIFPLASVAALPASHTASRPRQWVTVDGAPLAEAPSEFIYDTGGHYPADRLRLLLPEANSLGQVRLFSRTDAGKPWQARQNALVYRLHTGAEELTSPEIELLPVADRYWRLRIESIDGLGKQAPKLQLGWLGGRLLFVARGAPPFLLAYGSTGVFAASCDPSLATLAAKPPQLLARGTAQAGEPVVLGGEKKLDQRFRNWKEWLLWTVLGGGVALLAGMALRLLRQVDADRERTK